MRVLFCITKGAVGGAQRYVLDLATAGRQRGMEVAVAHGTSGWLTNELDSRGIKRATLPHLSRDVYLRDDLAALRELWRVIRAERPDVLHLNSSKAAALGAFVGRLLRVPRIVVTVHGWAFNEERPMHERIAIYVVQWMTTLLSHVSIVISHADAAQGRNMFWCRNKITLIHNGVGPFPRLPKYEARGVLSERSRALQRNGLWIGTIAELTGNKGIDILIGAFEAMSEDEPQAQLVIIGGGALWNTLTARARSLRAAQRIHFINLGDEPAARLIAAFDIFVLPSRKEGLPYALLEAGLAALPCLATRVGGNLDIIEHDVTGMLVPPGDTAALAEALRKLAPDIPTRVRVGRALQTRVETLFTAAQMAEATFALYRR